MKRDYRLYIDDIIEAIDKIEGYIQGYSMKLRNRQDTRYYARNK